MDNVNKMDNNVNKMDWPVGSSERIIITKDISVKAMAHWSVARDEWSVIGFFMPYMGPGFSRQSSLVSWACIKAFVHRLRCCFSRLRLPVSM